MFSWLATRRQKRIEERTKSILQDAMIPDDTRRDLAEKFTEVFYECREDFDFVEWFTEVAGEP